jgi:hypothetical protein
LAMRSTSADVQLNAPSIDSASAAFRSTAMRGRQFEVHC